MSTNTPLKSSPVSYARELWSTRELLWNLTLREVRGKYRRTVFGQLWSLVNPLAQMLVYSLVFAVILRARPAVGEPSGLNIYPLWLLSGLLAWTFFSRVIQSTMASLVQNAGLVKKVYFPRMQLPFSITLSTGFTWSLELGVLMVATLICGGMPLPWIPLVLVFMVLLAIFAVGLGMLLAIVNVHFRDTQHFVTIALHLLQYLTPIMYPVTIVEAAAVGGRAWILPVYLANPMQSFVSAFRAMIYDNTWPPLVDTIACVAWAVGIFTIGYLVFSRSERRLAELL